MCVCVCAVRASTRLAPWPLFTRSGRPRACHSITSEIYIYTFQSSNKTTSTVINGRFKCVYNCFFLLLLLCKFLVALLTIWLFSFVLLFLLLPLILIFFAHYHCYIYIYTLIFIYFISMLYLHFIGPMFLFSEHASTIKYSLCAIVIWKS